MQDLLKQRGISARLDGAGLQSGVGELPAVGLVRLVVDENDFDAARAVIDEWEKTSVPDAVSKPPKQSPGAIVGAVIGLVIGIGGALVYFRAPVNVGGIDHNGDGVLDERWKTSRSGMLVRTEIDRNFDGAVDFFWSFDHDGRAELGESDDDFNGTFETQFKLRDGQVYRTQVDTDGDSAPDLSSTGKFGVVTTVKYTANKSSNPVRVETYHLGKLVSAEVDADRDGRLDRLYTYGAFGEIAETRAIGSPE